MSIAQLRIQILNSIINRELHFLAKKKTNAKKGKKKKKKLLHFLLQSKKNAKNKKNYANNGSYLIGWAEIKEQVGGVQVVVFVPNDRGLDVLTLVSQSHDLVCVCVGETDT